MKLYIIFFCLCLFKLHGQADTIQFYKITKRIFDCRLNIIDTNSKKPLNKSFILVSDVNCIACVEYFVNANKINFLFILKYESLSEINEIISRFGAKKNQCYFTTVNDLSEMKDLILKGPTPILLKKIQIGFIVYNYFEVDKLSNSFTNINYSFLK